MLHTAWDNDSEPDQHGQRLGPFAALLGWVLGTALQLHQPALWGASSYGALAVCATVLGRLWWRQVAVRGNASQRILGSMVLAAALAFAVTGLRSSAFDATALSPALEGKDLLLTGVVTDMPQRNESGLRFTLAVDTVHLSGQAIAVPARVDVGWYGGVYSLGSEQVILQRQPGDVRAGERWRMLVRLKAPHGSRNPFGFDYELWMWERGVQATGYVRAGANDPKPQRLEQTGAHPVALLRQTLRERITTQVEQRQWAGLIAALVVGDQNAIDRVDWDVFRATGVAHLVSISGLHITMFAWAAVALVGWLWRRSAALCAAVPAPTAALWSGVLLALAYAVFSGWGIPAQRTCLMLGVVAALRLFGLRWPWPQTWMLACALVVASDPWALLQAGFWLSFVAVGVLFAAAPGAPGGAEPAATQLGHTAAGLLQGAAERVVGLLREQWVITVALAPLTLLLFGQVSLVGLVANAVAIPWVTLVVTPLAMLGVALPGAWDWAGVAIGWLMAGLQWLAALPWATLSLPTAPWWLASAGVLGGVVLVAPLPWHVRGLGLPLLLPVLLWQAPVPPLGHFALMAADVGQGNAVLVRTTNHALLFDAGQRYSRDSDAGHRVIVPLLRALGTRLDTVLISHRDTDHIGGAAAVLAMQPQAQLLSSIASDDPLQTLRTAQRCAAGQHWEWDGVRFDILHPQPTGYTPGAKPNTLSCVLRIQSSPMPDQVPQVALLVGDIEAQQEAQLLAAAAPLRADVLLVPHHGSKTSSSDAFLDAVQPREAWVQAGYRNRYGHPAPDVLARYQARGIVVRDSPRCGAMDWSSERPLDVRCNRAHRLRYWHHRVP
jgi:competence protein ComEC